MWLARILRSFVGFGVLFSSLGRSGRIHTVKLAMMKPAIVLCILMAGLLNAVHSFQLRPQKVFSSSTSLRMSLQDITLHSIHTAPHWVEYAAQGIADAAKVCPNFGEKGWAPFCFLNGNPVFNAFDGFQLFIQNSVVSLHDLLKVKFLYHLILSKALKMSRCRRGWVLTTPMVQASSYSQFWFDLYSFHSITSSFCLRRRLRHWLRRLLRSKWSFQMTKTSKTRYLMHPICSYN